MSACLSRRTLLAGLAAMPALALVGCGYDRTTAAPISTVDTLDFANRLRIPALAESIVDNDGVRVFRLSAVSGSAEFLSGLSTPDLGLYRRSIRRRVSRPNIAGSTGGANTGHRREPTIRDHYRALARYAPSSAL